MRATGMKICAVAALCAAAMAGCGGGGADRGAGDSARDSAQLSQLEQSLLLEEETRLQAIADSAEQKLVADTLYRTLFANDGYIPDQLLEQYCTERLLKRLHNDDPYVPLTYDLSAFTTGRHDEIGPENELISIVQENHDVFRARYWEQGYKGVTLLYFASESGAWRLDSLSRLLP